MDHYAPARSILGADFISSKEITSARGITYTDEQLAKFGETLPDQAALEWCRDNGMMLVAGPPKAMSLLDVRSLNADYFYAKGPERNDSGWYDDANETFARTDKVEALTWVAFRKEPVADSFDKTWPEKQELVSALMTVPNVAEAAWGITTYKAVREIYLLPDVYIRTSSVDWRGYHVHIGGSVAGRLDVRSCRDDRRYLDVGVSASRKF